MATVPELTELITPASDDLIEAVDVSDTTDGANGTSKKLALSNLGTGSGSSFPLTPYTGQQYFRSDIGLKCYYDGTQWLTAEKFSANLKNQSAVSASPTFLYIAVIMSNYAPYFTDVAAISSVATTNNGSNYWTLTFQGVNDAISAATIIQALDTSADTASTNTRHEDNSPAAPNPANKGLVRLALTKTGSPGDITIQSASVYFRYIIT